MIRSHQLSGDSDDKMTTGRLAAMDRRTCCTLVFVDRMAVCIQQLPVWICVQWVIDTWRYFAERLYLWVFFTSYSAVFVLMS